MSVPTSDTAAVPSTPSGPAVRVLHVIGCLDRGGAETVSLDLCRAVAPTDVEQTFVTVNGFEGSLAGQFRAAGAHVTQCPFDPRRSFAARLWRLLRATRPDVVVSHVSLSSGPILLLARAAGVPVRVARVWSAGDGRRDTRARRARRALFRRLLRHGATDVVAVTAAALRFARPPRADPRYRVLYNSVDPTRLAGADRVTARRRWGLPDEATVLVHLGRAAPEKNRPFLVEVHRAAHLRRPGTRLLVAGAGGTADLTGAHPEVVDDPTVVLAGEVADIAPVLAAADVLLLPSLREGLPGVVLEALAAGVPVVASDLPCVREVADQVPGVLPLPLSAGPGRWAECALTQADTSPAHRAGIIRGLRASPFLLDRSVRAWRELWRAGRR